MKTALPQRSWQHSNKAIPNNLNVYICKTASIIMAVFYRASRTAMRADQI